MKETKFTERIKIKIMYTNLEYLHLIISILFYLFSLSIRLFEQGSHRPSCKYSDCTIHL